MSLTRRKFLGACTAIGSVLGLGPAAAGKIAKQHTLPDGFVSRIVFSPEMDLREAEAPRVMFPPGTLIAPDVYRLPSGGTSLTPGGWWGGLDFQVTRDGQDTARSFITEVFTGPKGYIKYFATIEKGGIRYVAGNVTFSYQPPED